MTTHIKSIWLITREYAGVAEAGGVKNVSCSLAEGLARQGKQVTVFIPRYACVSMESKYLFSETLCIACEEYPVNFSVAYLHGVEIIFIESWLFAEKHAVYVYTESEAEVIPGAVCGKGHADADIMNMILQKAVLAYAIRTGFVPDILHCQDAHTALIPALVRTENPYSDVFDRTALLVTIHNAGPGYRQVISDIYSAAYLTGLSHGILEKGLLNGRIEPFLLAAEYAHLTTVSPWYASELTSSAYDSFSEKLSGEFEKRHITVTGITNGIDYDRYDPRDVSASLLQYPFDPITGRLEGKYQNRIYFFNILGKLSENPNMTCFGGLRQNPHAVYFTYQGRIARQKGLETLVASAKIVLGTIPEARFIILGQGEPYLETILIRMVQEYPGRFLFVRGYERSLARLAVTISDFLVLPSVFEPCGLEDLIGQIYGSLPVAHAVGGLQKIVDGKTGFLYSSGHEENDAIVLANLLVSLAKPIIASDREGCVGVPAFFEMIRFAAGQVRQVSNWNMIISESYLPFYEKIHSERA